MYYQIIEVSTAFLKSLTQLIFILITIDLKMDYEFQRVNKSGSLSQIGTSRFEELDLDSYIQNVEMDINRNSPRQLPKFNLLSPKSQHKSQRFEDVQARVYNGLKFKSKSKKTRSVK